MKILIALIILLGVLLKGSFISDRPLDARVDSIVRSHAFSVIGWEVGALWQDARQFFSRNDKQDDDEIGLVVDYFTRARGIRALNSEIAALDNGGGDTALPPLRDELDGLLEKQDALIDTIERILNKQRGDVLAGQGIYNPFTDLEFSFPPVNFILAELPDLLVISPRDRIESVKQVLLEQGLTLEEKEGIEAGVDDPGVVSLVVEIGGIATYPTLVDNEANLRYTIDTIVQEWLHQYLAFKPLGFRYVLDLSGISRNYDIATMNESLAGMVSKEIGFLVYGKYYSGAAGSTVPVEEAESEFDLEMRETRKTVDAYLERGDIEQAEIYMEQRRRRLVSMGYHIRKLNQAYFAFHGTYADTPAFISPIVLDLRELRDRSDSLEEFLERVASMTSRQELADSVK